MNKILRTPTQYNFFMNQIILIKSHNVEDPTLTQLIYIYAFQVATSPKHTLPQLLLHLCLVSHQGDGLPSPNRIWERMRGTGNHVELAMLHDPGWDPC